MNPPKTPVRIDPSIIQELEKLIEDFSKYCSLGRNGTAPVPIPELPQIFRVKKITKKRKAEDEQQKLKRRPKKEKTGEIKENTNSNMPTSNPNEQRLPLKKRHYRVSSPHSSLSSSSTCSAEAAAGEVTLAESHIEEAIEATITRYGDKEIKATTVPVTPKKRHRDADSVEKKEEKKEESLEKVQEATDTQPRRKKKIVKDLRVTVTKLTTDSVVLEKLVAEAKKEAENQEKEVQDKTKKKARRRKAINRTGFPSVKKKKKKKVQVGQLRVRKDLVVEVKAEEKKEEEVSDDDICLESLLARYNQNRSEKEKEKAESVKEESVVCVSKRMGSPLAGKSTKKLKTGEEMRDEGKKVLGPGRGRKKQQMWKKKEEKSEEGKKTEEKTRNKTVSFMICFC